MPKKKIRLILLYAAAVTCLFAYPILRLMPPKIYLMPINAWERKIWMGPGITQKEENYVVYWHLFKNEQALADCIIAFNDRTLSMDSIEKYPDGYCRSFSKGV